jgi:Flp pilus assembly protein TadD
MTQAAAQEPRRKTVIVRRWRECVIPFCIVRALAVVVLISAAAGAQCLPGAGDTRDADLEQARALVRNGSLAEAVVLLHRVVERHPNDADAHLLLGSVLALVPSRSEAVAEVRRAIELRPDSASSYNTLGMMLARFAEFELARQAFERAIRVDPRFAEAHQNLGLVLAQTSEYKLAGEHVARALELSAGSPKTAYLHLLNGRILGAQEKHELAAREFETAIRLRPDYPEAYLDLAAAKDKLLDEAGRFQALRKAVQLAPQNVEARYQLGKEYLTRGDGAKAVEHLRVAYRLKPDDRGTLYNYSRALRLSGQEEEAKAVSLKLAEVVRASSRASEYFLEAAKLTDDGAELEKRGDIRAAIVKYRAALELDPFVSTVRRNLGLALCRVGRYDEGIAELKEILRLDPNDAATTKALYIALDQAAAERARAGKHDK